MNTVNSLNKNRCSNKHPPPNKHPHPNKHPPLGHNIKQVSLLKQIPPLPFSLTFLDSRDTNKTYFYCHFIITFEVSAIAESAQVNSL